MLQTVPFCKMAKSGQQLQLPPNCYTPNCYVLHFLSNFRKNTTKNSTKHENKPQLLRFFVIKWLQIRPFWKLIPNIVKWFQHVEKWSQFVKWPTKLMTPTVLFLRPQIWKPTFMGFIQKYHVATCPTCFWHFLRLILAVYCKSRKISKA